MKKAIRMFVAIFVVYGLTVCGFKTYHALYPKPTPYTFVEKIKMAVGLDVNRPNPSFLKRVDNLMIDKTPFFKHPTKALIAKASLWDKTKMMGYVTWDKTKEYSKTAWNSTKDFTSNSWDKTKEYSKTAWNSTKSFTANSWNWLKAKFHRS